LERVSDCPNVRASVADRVQNTHLLAIVMPDLGRDISTAHAHRGGRVTGAQLAEGINATILPPR